MMLARPTVDRQVQRGDTGIGRFDDRRIVSRVVGSAQYPISTLLMRVPWLSESVPQMEKALDSAGANIGGSQAVGE